MSLAQQFLSKFNESSDIIDTVKINVVTLIRVMEYARENIKSDDDLHKLVEQLVVANKSVDTLSMIEVDPLLED